MRRAKLDAIRDACRAYITGPLRDFLTAQLADITNGAGPKMVDALARDYANMAAMIFGTPPSFDDILEAARQIEQDINTHS